MEPHLSQSTMSWLQLLDTPLKALAVLIGGLWVLMNYYRGRTTSHDFSSASLPTESFAMVYLVGALEKMP
jgi:hypothetical protein